MRHACAALALVLSLTFGAANAQDQTLADVRQEIAVLVVELQTLKRELSTTGGVQTNIAGDTLQRVDLIEQELQRLTARTEALEFRIERVVQDGTNRVGDLEFRLCELETDCDIATLGETPRIGGETQPNVDVVAPVEQPDVTTELAIGERADFDRAVAALENGDPGQAVDLFASFTETYPGSPLSGEAHFFRGTALLELGRNRDAGLAYLESFSGTPSGPVAADALLGLGTALGKLQQIDEACATLTEVGVRFPGSELIQEAEAERSRLGCS